VDDDARTGGSGKEDENGAELEEYEVAGRTPPASTKGSVAVPSFSVEVDAYTEAIANIPAGRTVGNRGTDVELDEDAAAG